MCVAQVCWIFRHFERVDRVLTMDAWGCACVCSLLVVGLSECIPANMVLVTGVFGCVVESRWCCAIGAVRWFLLRKRLGCVGVVFALEGSASAFGGRRWRVVCSVSVCCGVSVLDLEMFECFGVCVCVCVCLCVRVRPLEGPAAGGLWRGRQMWRRLGWLWRCVGWCLLATAELYACGVGAECVVAWMACIR